MQISIKIFALAALIIVFGCRKHSNVKPASIPVINLDSIYKMNLAAKYTPLMGGSRLWHRYRTYYLYTGGDTIVKLTDTIGAITIVSSTLIIFPPEYGGAGAILTTATANMLYFYSSYYLNYGPPLPSDQWSAYYFPANDSISLIEEEGINTQDGFGYHSQ